MGLPIQLKSLGYLNEIFTPEETKDWKVFEYRDSSKSTVSMQGHGVEENKEKISFLELVSAMRIHVRGYGQERL
jgi:hypothetical protein